jgi:tRNA (guanine9-N1)-methyltransferase
MEADERPTKLQKLSCDQSDDENPHDDLAPVMTGAIDPNEDTLGSPLSTEAAHDIANFSHDQREQSGGVPTSMSKTQWKKLQRQQKWEAGRDLRKVKRKEKLIARKERKRAAREVSDGNSVQGNNNNLADMAHQRRPRSVLLPVTFILDCGFDDLMVDKERISLASQLSRCYSDNSRAVYRSHMVISSFDKLLKDRFDTTLRKAHKGWKGVRFMQEDFVHAATMAKNWMEPPKGGKMQGLLEVWTNAKPEDGEIVYLTGDSPDTLTKLKPYSSYIIGGLVDKNRHKGICYKTAVERGIKTAKLPIGDYMEMSSRFVLTTNHVVEIMLKWLESGDWGEAFLQVMPKRKGGVLKRMVSQDADKDEKDGETASSDEDEDQDPAPDEIPADPIEAS